MVYDADAMFPIEINTLKWRLSQFNKEENEAGLRCVADLIDETSDVTHIR